MQLSWRTCNSFALNVSTNYSFYKGMDTYDMLTIPIPILHTEIFLLLAMTTAKSVKRFRMTTFDLVTLVQALQRLQTSTNSVIVVLRFTLFAFSVARSSKSSVPIGIVIVISCYSVWMTKRVGLDQEYINKSV